MGIDLRRFFSVILVSGFAVSLSACGSTIAENAALADQPLQGANARLKIVRPEAFAGMAVGARVRIDGREVANLGNGGSIILNVAAGAHNIVVDNWSHPNVYTIKLDAKAHTQYSLEVTVRDEAVVAGMFGAAGALAESAANENGGTFQVRVVDSKPLRT
jgi:hypothetical protein